MKIKLFLISIFCSLVFENFAYAGDSSGVEMSGTEGVSDGSMSADEAAEKLENAMTRVEGENSVEQSRALRKALNEKNGLNMAAIYAKGLVLRQELRDEDDVIEEPEEVNEAVKLQQDMAVSSLKRRNKVLNMDATVTEYLYTNRLLKFSRDSEDGGNQ